MIGQQAKGLNIEGALLCRLPNDGQKVPPILIVQKNGSPPDTSCHHMAVSPVEFNSYGALMRRIGMKSG